jgi:hypothetical protein
MIKERPATIMAQTQREFGETLRCPSDNSVKVESGYDGI